MLRSKQYLKWNKRRYGRFTEGGSDVKVKINLNMCYMKSTSLTILKKLKDNCKSYFKRHYDQQIN